MRDLVYAYNKHQGVDAAFAAVEDMKRQGLRPDGRVYYALLHACAQVGISFKCPVTRPKHPSGLGLKHCPPRAGMALGILAKVARQ